MIRLTREQRAAFFDRTGEIPLPRITFPGDRPCPVKVGHIEHLSPHIWFQVTAIRRTRKGEHSLSYDLHRPGDRYLAAQNGQTHPEQYSHSGGSPIDWEAGQAVDALEQKRQTREARDKDTAAIGELLVVLGELRSAVSERLADNPEALRLMGRDAWALRSKIDALERRLKRRHAA